jgi:hypothetical protein
MAIRSFCKFLLFVLPALAGPAGAQTGRVDLRLTNHLRQQTLVFRINLDRGRSSLEIDQGEGMSRVRLINDSSDQSVVYLIDKEGAPRQGMVRPMPAMPAPARPAPLEAKETGETRSINGQPCRKAMAEGGGARHTFWVAADSSFDYNKLLDFLLHPAHPSAPYLYNLRHAAPLSGFPLEVTVVPDANPADSTTAVFLNFNGMVDERAFRTDGFNLTDVR